MSAHRIGTLGILAASLWVVAGANAAPAADNELTQMRAGMDRLNAQQQQILASLDELKKMMAAPSQPTLKPPQTLRLAGEPFKGEPAAKVAIIEYADFQCPFCRRFEHEVYPQIRDNYVNAGKLKYFHRDMPLSFHPGALPAARAAHCASEQGKFWEMHDALLGDAASLTSADIDERAAKLGLDIPKLDQCISSDRFADIIQRSVTEAHDMRISGTPTFLIGTLNPDGQSMSVKATVVGASPFETFKVAIDPLIASVK